MSTRSVCWKIRGTLQERFQGPHRRDVGHVVHVVIGLVWRKLRGTPSQSKKQCVDHWAGFGWVTFQWKINSLFAGGIAPLFNQPGFSYSRVDISKRSLWNVHLHVVPTCPLFLSFCNYTDLWVLHSHGSYPLAIKHGKGNSPTWWFSIFLCSVLGNFAMFGG
jgi:hypothetical protein